MPKLDLPRHEQFAKCMALGVLPAAECYINAGYPPDRAAAINLAKTPLIAQRIQEIEIEKLSNE